MALGRINPPIGRHFLDHDYPVELIIKEKVLSLTGDAFEVKQNPGTGQNPFPIFKISPSMFTSKKEFLGMDGKKLFHLRKEHFHLHDYMKLEDENGKFCEMKKNFTSTCLISTCHVLPHPKLADTSMSQCSAPSSP